MRTTALVLAITGLVFGLLGWMFSVSLSSGGMNEREWLALFCLVMGFWIVIDSRKHPVWDGWGMIVVDALGFLAIGLFWIVPLPLLLIAGVLTLVSPKSEPLAA